MVEIRQDQLPKTIVAGLDATVSLNPECQSDFISPGPGEWLISNGTQDPAGNGGHQPGDNGSSKNGWEFSEGGEVTIPDTALYGKYEVYYATEESCDAEGYPSYLNYRYTFKITGNLTGDASLKFIDGFDAVLDLTAEATASSTVTATVDWDDSDGTGQTSNATLTRVSGITDKGEGSASNTYVPSPPFTSGKTKTYTATAVFHTNDGMAVIMLGASRNRHTRNAVNPASSASPSQQRGGVQSQPRGKTHRATRVLL